MSTGTKKKGGEPIGQQSRVESEKQKGLKVADKHAGKGEIQTGINLIPRKREWAFLRKTGPSNILVTQGLPWETEVFSH